MKYVIGLLALLGFGHAWVAQAAPIPYRVWISGQVEEIVGPNPYAISAGAPLLAVVNFTLEEPWQPGQQRQVWSSAFTGNSPGTEAAPVFDIIYNPLPWYWGGLDYWIFDVQPDGGVSGFQSSSGYCTQVRQDFTAEQRPGAHFRLSDCLHDGLETVLWGSVTFTLGPGEPAGEDPTPTPEPATWLAGLAAVAVLLAKRKSSENSYPPGALSRHGKHKSPPGRR